MTRKRTWSAASIKAQLLSVSKESNEQFQHTLERFALERFLVRLQKSRHRNRFTLKGAKLYSIWTEQPHRPTRDLDLLGEIDPELDAIKGLMKEICSVDVPVDGMRFDSDSVQVSEIREGQSYGGVRTYIVARLGKATCRIQIDIGFGDTVTPESMAVTLPPILDGLEPVTIPAYTLVTVVAEKLEAMVSIGAANSRVKDFYDLWVFSRRFPFEGLLLTTAIGNTFRRRKTPFPYDTPVALTVEFAHSPMTLGYWTGFLLSAGLNAGVPPFPKVIEDIAVFALPPLQAVASGIDFGHSWSPGGPWSAA